MLALWCLSPTDGRGWFCFFRWRERNPPPPSWMYNHITIPIRDILLLSPLYRREDWGSENISDLSKTHGSQAAKPWFNHSVLNVGLCSWLPLCSGSTRARVVCWHPWGEETICGETTSTDSCWLLTQSWPISWYLILVDLSRQLLFSPLYRWGNWGSETYVPCPRSQSALELRLWSCSSCSQSGSFLSL